MSVHSTLFPFNIDEEKKVDSQLGPLSLWSLHILTIVHVGLLPHPKDVHVGCVCVSTLSPSE